VDIYDTVAGDSLEIRRGNSSTGELVPWMHRSELNDSTGLYIRVRMLCAPGNGFAATFVWMRSSQENGKLNWLQILVQPT